MANLAEDTKQWPLACKETGCPGERHSYILVHISPIESFFPYRSTCLIIYIKIVFVFFKKNGGHSIGDFVGVLRSGVSAERCQFLDG